MKKIYILGVGNNTAVCIDLAQRCGYEVAGLFHYQKGREGEIYYGEKIIGSFDDLFASATLGGMDFLLSMGNNEIRGKVAEQIKEKGGNLPAMIHPSSSVSISKSAVIGSGVRIGSHVTIMANSKVSDNTYIAPGVFIGHDVSIGSNCLIAANSVIGTYAHVEDHVFIGYGAVVISPQVKTIGHHSCVGAGAVLTKSIPPFSKMAGNPAKEMK